MRFMVISKQRTDLNDAQQRTLYEAIQAFYANPPATMTVESDYVLADRTGSYSIVEVADRATLDTVMRPFDGLVNVEINEVVPARG